MAMQSILLFAHQARSYLPLVQQTLKQLGIGCLVLSSRARDQQDLDHLISLGPDRLWQVDDEYLDQDHVAGVLEDALSEGYEIIGALATFEGYRMLMALTNSRLGAVDADPASIRHCMDKYLCRSTLAEHGLSRARATLLNAESLDCLRRSDRKLFVKPRRGAGSFACFRLDATLTAGKLHELQQQMRNDLAFRAIFDGQFDFLAEDYIAGDEYSFEVLVVDGESYVIGVHAKYLDESGGTTLETSNSCPASRLTDEQQLAGERYVDCCLKTLNLREGCYHIEARHDPRDGNWDIIEINARMGGALINQSIGVFTGGISMLDLWIKAICNRAAAQRHSFARDLSALRESTRRASKEIVHGTVFFSRYGERNRTLERISIENLPRKPDLLEIPVREGTRLPNSDRGIFILNALWKVNIPDIAQELKFLSEMLDDKLLVQYSGNS